MIPRRVLASCTADKVGYRLWAICVTGVAPDDCTRTYRIFERTEDRAAQEGLRQFVDEMTKAKTKHPLLWWT